MKHVIVTLKAFGDFVIACNAIRRVQLTIGIDVPGIIAGEHVRSLASALGLDALVQFIGDKSWIDVPAAFDVRKRGIFSALMSLNDLHRRLGDFHSNNTLVFDNLGWREQFIGRGRVLESLPAESGNIYIAYDRFFESLGVRFLNTTLKTKLAVSRAIIIPGARMAHRKIPAPVIKRIVAELHQLDIKTCVVVLDGESINLLEGIHVKKIPRSFDALIAAVQASELVISADSLPSHLSEFLGVPVFVSTPLPKPYWLPRSAYLENGWATFEDIYPLRNWLSNHFEA
jgi:hypothetical protein